MKRLAIIALIIVSCMGILAQPVKVGLYQEKLVHAAVTYCSSGTYQLLLDGRVVARLEEGAILYLTLENEKVRVLDGERDFGLAGKVEMKALSVESVFRLRPIKPELHSRTYDDNLLVIPEDRYLTLVNEVDMDKYLAGVVEAESGTRAEKEYYKAQSILCRTYTLKQLERHNNEGFSLCDRPHCQVYRGRSKGNPRYWKLSLKPVERFWPTLISSL